MLRSNSKSLGESTACCEQSFIPASSNYRQMSDVADLCYKSFRSTAVMAWVAPGLLKCHRPVLKKAT